MGLDGEETRSRVAEAVVMGWRFDEMTDTTRKVVMELGGGRLRGVNGEGSGRVGRTRW